MQKRELTWTEKKLLWQGRRTLAMFVLSGVMILWSGVALLLWVGDKNDPLALGLLGHILGLLCGIIGLVVAFASRQMNRDASLHFQRLIWRARVERYAKKRKIQARKK